MLICVAPYITYNSRYQYPASHGERCVRRKYMYGSAVQKLLCLFVPPSPPSTTTMERLKGTWKRWRSKWGAWRPKQPQRSGIDCWRWGLFLRSYLPSEALFVGRKFFQCSYICAIIKCLFICSLSKLKYVEHISCSPYSDGWQLRACSIDSDL